MDNPFIKKKEEFEELMDKIVKKGDKTLESIHKASIIAQTQNKGLDKTKLNEAKDSIVYLHITNKLEKIIDIIRDCIHNEDFEEGKSFLKDMRVHGDFIKDKGLKFNFEFYNKIEDFFKNQPEDYLKNIPKFKKETSKK